MNNKYKILVVEDEKNIQTLVSALLETEGYSVISAYNLAEADMLFVSHRPDLIILDLGMPDGDGIVFLKKLRKTTAVPLIVLSARNSESDKVDALDAGANDYVTKPFSSAEFLARIRSALRSVRLSETGRLPHATFNVDDLKIDYESRRIFIANAEIRLTQTEYNIVAFLAQNAGKMMTYQGIIKAIWGYPDGGGIKKLQVNMANIRKKFGIKPGEESYIVNELGVGYRMKGLEE
ncbi:MAG: response regulator transcription factor [Clostridia bacterium]|nr:response regulator transcription factor [Clostridia bacterium]